MEAIGAVRRCVLRRGYASAASAAKTRVVSAWLSSRDPAATTQFYLDVLPLKRARQVNTEARGRIVLWDGLGLSCGVTLWQQPSSSDALRDTMQDPFPSATVSNLRTSLRQVKRRGGTVVFEPGTGGMSATEALVRDVDGRLLRLVHAYRRTPIAALTLPCTDYQRTAAACARILGMTQVTQPEELAELHLSEALHGRAAAVLTAGPAHNTTAIVCVQRGLPIPPVAPSATQETTATDAAALSPPIIAVEVADLEAAHAHAAAEDGWAVSDLPADAAGEARSFTCSDPDEHLWLVTEAGAATPLT